jgi:hypothetical protein
MDATSGILYPSEHLQRSNNNNNNNNNNNYNNNNSIQFLSYLCAESTALRPITDTAQCTCK